LTNDVNGVSRVLLPNLFEGALREFRSALYELSDARYPGLRARHYRLLSFIPDEGIRLTQVAEASGLTKQALAQALAPLEAGGYLEVVPDPADRRARIVRRTARGHEVVDAVLALQDGFEQRWAAHVGAERWAGARQVLAELFLH
jgi:DNA-binding MarR family transcriptional regulator